MDAKLLQLIHTNDQLTAIFNDAQPWERIEELVMKLRPFSSEHMAVLDTEECELILALIQIAVASAGLASVGMTYQK